MPAEATLETPAAPSVSAPGTINPATVKPSAIADDNPFSAYETDTQPPEPEKPAPRETPKPAPSKAPAKAPAKAPTKDAAKPDVSNADTKPADPAKPAQEWNPDEAPPAGAPPKWYRERLDRAAAHIKKVEQELGELKTRSTMPNGEIPEDHPQFKSLREQAESASKRAQELDSEMRYLAYEKSSEYKERYEKPYLAICQSAAATVGEMRITNEDGTVRPATPDDLWKIVSIPNVEDALAAAEEIFGTPTKANFIMGLRGEIRKAHLAAEQAKEDYRTQGAERSKQTEEQKTQQYKHQMGVFKKLTQDAIAKYPQWFQADETDPKAKELLTKGMERADQAFSGKEMSPDEAVRLHAVLRNKAGAFDHVVYKFNKAQSRIKELEAELAAFQKSEPGEGEVRGDNKSNEDDLGDPFKKFE